MSASESFVWVLADYEGYPADEKAEYSVCYFLESGSVWVFIPAPDRATAESILRDISSRSEGVLTVSIETGPNAGRKSPVVWIAQRHRSEWRRIKATEGADQYVGGELVTSSRRRFAARGQTGRGWGVEGDG